MSARCAAAIRYGGGINLYAYVGNNPVMCADPSELDYKYYLLGVTDAFNPIEAGKRVVALGRYLFSGKANAKELGTGLLNSLNPVDPYISDREMGRRATGILQAVAGGYHGGF